MSLVASYARWLHTQWPAGTVEPLPECQQDGATAVPGVRIVGDLTGVPLLKFASATGAQAVRAILAEATFRPSTDDELFDVIIVGGGVSGVAATIEARRAGLRTTVFEASEAFSTVANFPAGKPIFTYPPDMAVSGGLQMAATVKEGLIAELERQRAQAGVEPVISHVDRVERRAGVLIVHHADGQATRAQRVIIAIGRSGNYRKLGCPGDDLGKVYNRLHDPKPFRARQVLVVGGGDSAIEAAVALASAGAWVTLSYRRRELARVKPDNLDALARAQRGVGVAACVTDPAPPTRPASQPDTTSATCATSTMSGGSLCLMPGTQVTRVDADTVELRDDTTATTSIPNEVVFAMIGREAPLEFFRRSRLPIRGEWRPATWCACLAFLLCCVVLYHWKSPHQEFPLQPLAAAHRAFPYNVPGAIDALGGQVAEWANRPTHLLYSLKLSLGNPGFYYTLAYCAVVVVFGVRRIRRRPTPYVRRQTLTLMAVQCVPLFLLPELLPWIGRNGWFEPGRTLGWLADQLFESYDGGIGHERAYWRAYGLVLAFPLNVYNVFTERPMWMWLGISACQTFVVIPLIVWRWGKGAYCGWICSCGALAETVGDRHRQKMPHGPVWNRVNMLGQAILAIAALLLGLRVAGWWLGPASWAAHAGRALLNGVPFFNYAWLVDTLLAGIVGVGMYFWASGRVWCRFACPLAALMHIYARFSRFRIFSDKAKCISCNVCTAVCHQGIDVMQVANRGLPMQDPECVRCSACVQQCPTGVLAFGRFDAEGGIVLDMLRASAGRAPVGDGIDRDPFGGRGSQIY